ncbi:MAG: class I SAM-dependent methyltransferase [Candidatus Hodarchaeales archaeon]
MRDFNHNLQQLKMCNIKGDVWMDAGCGTGTYTIPLSKLVTKVIGIDKDAHAIQQLHKKLSDENIELIHGDFNQYPYPEKVDGVLFAFSLHFQLDQNKTLFNAFNRLKSNGTLIIFEYNQRNPLPWIPYPCPKEELQNILESIGFKRISLIYDDDRYYILKGVKQQ